MAKSCSHTATGTCRCLEEYNSGESRSVAFYSSESSVHASVEQRMNAIPSYRPVNLGPAPSIRQRFRIVEDIEG